MLLHGQNINFVVNENVFLFSHPNSTSFHIMQNGIFEKNIIEWCKQFGNPEKTFIDIGAHAGTYSIILADHFKNVHAFEAQRKTFYQLCGGIVLSGKNNIEAHRTALSDIKAKEKLHIFSTDGGSSSLNSEEFVGKLITTETVDVNTLDSFELKDVAFIKIDVEGLELNVLKGSLNTLKDSDFPKILFESNSYNKSLNDITELLKIYGYNIAPINGCKNMFLASI